MKDQCAQQTLMYKETQEAPSLVKRQFVANKDLIEKLAAQLRNNPPKLIVTCARGSSDNAATYAKYLIETHIGTPVLSAAPSISSVYAVRQDMENVLFVAISQSGQSPDISMAAQAAKEGGAFVVAFVNDSGSPLAKVSDMVIPIRAGREKSIAATKTFICTLSAIVHLVAEWQQGKELLADVHTLPALLETAFASDWSAGLDILKPAQNLFVVSRGLGFGIAQEAALKLKETCGLHAEAFSAAEVKHGPMTIVLKGFPVLLFSQNDQTQDSIDDVASAFVDRGAQVLSAGQHYENAHNLEIAQCPSAEFRPIMQIQSFYKFVNALSVARGYNPDSPPHLSKITETL